MIGDQLTSLEANPSLTILIAPNPTRSSVRQCRTPLRSDGTGSRSRRNPPPRSAGHSDLDELGDPEEGTPAHQGRPSGDDKALHGFVPPGPSQSSGKPPGSSARITSIPPAPLALTAPHLQLHSFVVGSAFVGTSTSVEARQWLPYLGSILRRSFGRILVTPGLSWILSGVELNETPSTSRSKFRIGHLTSSISIEFDADGAPEESDSFDSFEKDLNLRSRPRWNNAGGS